MATKKIILCDTNIFIEYFHGNEPIVHELDFLTFERLAMPAVAVAELYFGMRKRESDKTKALVRKFNLFHIDTGISSLFLQFILGYHDKGISIPDAHIAATAVSNNLEQFTLNRADFDFIKDLRLYKPKF